MIMYSIYRVMDLSDNILFIELPIHAQNVDCFSDELISEFN